MPRHRNNVDPLFALKVSVVYRDQLAKMPFSSSDFAPWDAGIGRLPITYGRYRLWTKKGHERPCIPENVCKSQYSPKTYQLQEWEKMSLFPASLANCTAKPSLVVIPKSNYFIKTSQSLLYLHASTN